MKQRRYPKRTAADPDWVTSVPHREDHVCMSIVDFSPIGEPIICGKNADVLLWWNRDSDPLSMCFDHYEQRSSGHRTKNEYGNLE
jgi:hypothetical protein